MKKLSLTSFLLLFLIPGFSQSAYFQFDAGSCLPLSPVTIKESVNTSILSQSTTLNEAVFFSLGEGYAYSVSVGAFILPGFSAGLRVQNLISAKHKYISESNIGSTKQVNEQTISSAIWLFTPEVRVNLPEWKVSPFLSFGLNFASGSVRKTEDIDRQGIKFKKIWDYEGSFSVNPVAGGGLIVDLTKKLQLNLQCRVCPMIYKPGRAVMTKANRNDIDNLPDYPIIEKEIDFVESLESDFSVPPDPDKPDKRLRENWAAGSIQFNAGLILLLGVE